MTDLVRTTLPRTALLLAAWLTACGADHGDDKTGSTGAATGSSAGPDTGATGDAASTGAAPDDAASTSATTGDAASTGEPADTCACFSSPGPGTFELLCPAEIKAEIDGACAGDDCTYDGVAIAAALAFLATGEPGIVLWTVDDGAVPATASPGPQTRDLGATCPYQYCRGGIHIVTGDGKVDLILGHSDPSGNAFLMLGNGDGTFQAATTLGGTGGSTHGIAIADVNGDGWMDVVVSAESDHGYSFISNAKRSK